MRLANIAFVLVLSGCVQAHPAQHPSAETAPSTVHFTHISKRPSTRDDAIHVLETTEQFEATAIGEAGVPSAEVCAFVFLMRDPDAVQVFQSLLDRANVAGQLYGLAGLYLLDRDLYATQVARYTNNDTWVSTMFGCIISTMKVSEIVHASGSRDLDIDRGGYPRRFAEFKGCTK